MGVVHFGRKEMTNFNYDECPYCNSENIEGYETVDLVTAEFSGSTVINNERCNDCKKRFKNKKSLKDHKLGGKCDYTGQYIDTRTYRSWDLSRLDNNVRSMNISIKLSYLCSHKFFNFCLVLALKSLVNFSS